jgi:ubiquinone biosynthesis O-methyltransferase
MIKLLMESDGELVKDIEESKKDFDAGRYYTLKTDEEKMKKYIGHLIYKTVGTPGFIRRIEWRIMLDWLDPKEGERILDVACGGGVLSLKIAERGCKVYGIDLSVNAINSAKRLAEREKMACKFEVGSAEDLPYQDGYFDKVVCSSSLEHFKDDIKALKEMNRVLKPNGSVVLTTDSFTYPISDELKEMHRKIAYVVNYYTPEKLKGC